MNVKNDTKLTPEQRQRAEALLEGVIDDPLTATYALISLRDELATTKRCLLQMQGAAMHLATIPQPLWTADRKGVMVLTPAGLRALEQNIALTDRCEELIAENDRLRATR